MYNNENREQGRRSDDDRRYDLERRQDVRRLMISEELLDLDRSPLMHSYDTNRDDDRRLSKRRMLIRRFMSDRRNFSEN